MPKILVQIPDGLLTTIDTIVSGRHYKSRSELVRESLRRCCVEFYHNANEKKEVDSITELPDLDATDDTGAE